ncbi:DNA recombination protein RmuC [Maridesulfovibrio salexigens]|uniref:DNA recombination protein RmuC n=1 Tax=Maridesulfovibrio salexigens (strain ATCC 14822 / DSM 2638 / NCIMB 8403 / VKM B-1763) TaxID=526222 RepID=C6BRK2_MARSD|nr:DNA recombination protein RmuC [Maridesulfovibrio salexigens]ACS79442.1 protein of unknown function DUF195 [Maridesulfovibrio salexigens DSM 2638]
MFSLPSFEMIGNEYVLLGIFFAGLVLGMIISAVIGKRRLAEEKEKVEGLQDHLQEQLQLGARLEEQATQLPELKKELAQQRAQKHKLTTAYSNLYGKYKATKANLDNEKKQGQEKLTLLQEAKEELSDKFKSLAGEILEEKSKKFTDQNATNIKQILAPLGVKIHEFQEQVEKAYFQEGKDRSELAAQVKQLMNLNRQLSDDAHNLTKALKGQSKTRGDWGELILERVLEASGLRKDHEYTVQVSHTRQDGTRVQPDVVIHLPEEKHLVVDSKVSLTDYLKYTEAEDETKREVALKGHINSIKAHLKGLSTKNYQDLYGIKSPDFVIMFVPIEPAFALAISNDVALWQEAWNKNVLIVSPSTLLFVIRTVAHIWRQERQNQNAQEIANRGAILYDKFRNFVDDLEKVGERIRQTQDSYEKARTKLCNGSGNLIRQAEMLKELGVKPKRSIKKDLTEEALGSDEFQMLTEGEKDG